MKSENNKQYFFNFNVNIMNKSKLLSVALVCALGLGVASCVEDKESASVENVRNAKAEQLKALAALSNAQAEATLLTAKAEAMLKEAEAAMREAEAANQTELTAEAKAKFEAEIEKIKAEAAAAVAAAEKAAKEAAEQMKANTQEHIATLFGNYQDANKELTGLKKDLIDEQMKLTELEAGLVSAEATAKKTIATQNNIIAAQEARLAALKALPANDHDALQSQLEELIALEEQLTAEKAITADARTKANDALKDARVAVEGGYDSQSNFVKPTTKTGLAALWLEDNYPHVLVYESKDVEKGDKVLNQPIEYYSLDQAEVTRTKSMLQNDVYTAQENLGTNKKDEETGLYVQLRQLADALADATTAYNDAVKNKEDASVIENLRMAKEQAVAAKQDYENTTLKYGLEDLADAKQDLEDFNANIAAFEGEDLEAYESAIDAAVKAGLAYLDAEVAFDKADQALMLNFKEQGDVQNLLSANKDLNTLIAECEENIAKAQEQIAKVNNALAGGTKQALVEECEATIENLKAEIAAQTIIVSTYKAELDAALA